jgi:hypothetical protein
MLRSGDAAFPNGLPGGHSEWEPPDPIPNSEVKLLSADDSMVFRHAKVGHCQAFYTKTPIAALSGFLFLFRRWISCSHLSFALAPQFFALLTE